MISNCTQAVVELFSRHSHHADGRFSLVVGAQSQEIADLLTTRLSNHHFKAEPDPFNVVDAGQDRCGKLDSCEQIFFLDSFVEHSKLQRQQVLSSVRDTMACRVLHLESELIDKEPWQLTDSLSLGYRRIDSGHHRQIPWQLYEFHIANYKSTPDWLNSDHWSNPQEWDRHRW